MFVATGCDSLLDAFIVSIPDELVTYQTDVTHETFTLGAPNATVNQPTRNTEPTTHNPKNHACQERPTTPAETARNPVAPVTQSRRTAERPRQSPPRLSVYGESHRSERPRQSPPRLSVYGEYQGTQIQGGGPTRWASRNAPRCAGAGRARLGGRQRF